MRYIFCFLFLSAAFSTSAQKPIFEFDNNATTRWSSPENLHGVKGAGAKLNGGAKGHAFDQIEAGESRILLDVQGSGIINRIWITVEQRDAKSLRSLHLQMFWDNQSKPAVSVPLGDFFSTALGKTATFENSLFSSPEGRSFVSIIPMPYRTGAKIVVVNESAAVVPHIFFDVDFQQTKTWKEDNLYFHAYWHRDTATVVGEDFELLPAVRGKGKYLGASVGINSNPVYGKAWWGEGEVKMFLDGDTDHPTISGTGTEDYIGTGWGQGKFINAYSGCLIADTVKNQWAFYRFHIPDPVYFSTGCKVTLQQIGGDMRDAVIELQKKKAPLIPVTLDVQGKLYWLFQKGTTVGLADPSQPKDSGWVNFYRSDDVTAVVYFYLDSPVNKLPALQPIEMRTRKLKN